MKPKITLKIINNFVLTFILSLVFLTDCKSQEKKDCCEELTKKIETNIKANLKITSQSDGIFKFVFDYEIKNNDVYLNEIKSKYNYSPIGKNIREALEGIKLNSNLCDGKYSFIIIINTINYDTKVIPLCKR